MSELIKSKVEEARNIWSIVAKNNDWYVEPFHVQVWIDKNGEILDSVSVDELISEADELTKMFVSARKKLSNRNN